MTLDDGGVGRNDRTGKEGAPASRDGRAEDATDGSLDGRTEPDGPMEAAERLLAEHLASRPTPSLPLADVEWTQLGDAHPALVTELAALRRGIERYDGLCRTLLAPETIASRVPAQPVAVRIAPWWRTRAAAAALLVALVGGAGWIVRWAITDSGTTDPAVTSQERIRDQAALSMVVQREVASFLRNAENKKWQTDVVALCKAIEQLPQQEPGAKVQPELERLLERFDESVALLNGSGELATSICRSSEASVQDRRCSNEVIASIAAIETRAASGTSPAPLKLLHLRQRSPGTAASSTARRATPQFVSSPFARAVTCSPAAPAFLRRVRRDPEIPEALARLLSAADQQAKLQLRVVDLDAGGEQVASAEVFAQCMNASMGPLSAPSQVHDGPVPCALTLAAGEWRLTVVHRPSGRHGELRLMALPQQDLGIQVVFLRDTETVLRGMAYRPATTIRYQIGEGAPESEVDVAEMWIDPYETSKEEWGAFYADVLAHAGSWFDGACPIGRPSFVMDDSGRVDAAIARHPVHETPWSEAMLYASWAGKRLPTDVEWVRVAYGSEGRRYPWGAEALAAAIDTRHSIVGADGAPIASVIGTSDRPAATPIEPHFDDYIEVDVDSQLFRGGATPPEDGDPVYRLADNVSEFVEDVAGVWSADDGAATYVFVDTYLHSLRGENYSTASRNPRTASPMMVVDRSSMSPLPWTGLRCVKTRLLPAFSSSQ